MAALNLLKNYNLTLAEIYQKRDIFEEIKENGSHVGVAAFSWVSKFIKTFILSTIIFGFIAVGIMIVFDPFYRVPVVATKVDNAPITPMEPTLSPAAPRYVQVQIIDFGQNGTGGVGISPDVAAFPAIAVDLANKPLVGKLGSTIPQKPVPVPAPKPKPKPVIIPPKVDAPDPKSFMYSISISNVSTGEYEHMRALANYSGVELDIVSSRKGSIPVWVLYVADDASATYVAGQQVSLLGKFETRSDALEYAAKRGTTPIVTTEEKSGDFYDLKVCCMDLDNAQLYAQMSGIPDKIFRLQPVKTIK